MKKILCAFALLILFCFALPAEFGSVLQITFSEADCFIYSREANGGESAEDGFCVVTRSNLSELSQNLEKCEGILGITAVFSAEKFSPRQLIQRLKARIIRRENVGDIEIFYCFSPMVCGSVKLFGTRVNLQVAVCGDGTVRLGSPLIVGGY